MEQLRIIMSTIVWNYQDIYYTRSKTGINIHIRTLIQCFPQKTGLASTAHSGYPKIAACPNPPLALARSSLWQASPPTDWYQNYLNWFGTSWRMRIIVYLCCYCLYFILLFLLFLLFCDFWSINSTTKREKNNCFSLIFACSCPITALPFVYTTSCKNRTERCDWFNIFRVYPPTTSA